MADQPIDPGRLSAWISDMRAQLERIEQARRAPEMRPIATDHASYRRHRRERIGEALKPARYTMTQ